ncbi:DUF6069 family protein [Embleya sp. NBC_00896]|uniref:DUF6069 family protein n=1 Tax=Embleya sp. NBC_00896 TaxID=2975961 RepID=UPI002F913402|nr:DUF6069 family protein [Embleya sp. NBC_00896]
MTTVLARSVHTSARRTRAVCVGLAVLANTVLFTVAAALGTDFEITDPGKTEAHRFVAPEIAVFTLAVGLLAWGTLAALERFTRTAKTIWAALAGAVLLLSFVPIGLEQATTDTRIVLGVLHLAAGAALLPMLRTTR